MEELKLQEIVNLLTEIRENEVKEMEYAKKRAKLSLIISGLCFLLVVGLAVGMLILIPKVNNMVKEAEEVISEVDGMMGDVEEVAENLNTVTTDLAEVDLKGVVGNIDSLVTESQKSIKEAMENLNGIDFDGLNKAIKDLEAVIKPLANLFG